MYNWEYQSFRKLTLNSNTREQHQVVLCVLRMEARKVSSEGERASERDREQELNHHVYMNTFGGFLAVATHYILCIYSNSCTKYAPSKIAKAATSTADSNSQKMAKTVPENCRKVLFTQNIMYMQIEHNPKTNRQKELWLSRAPIISIALGALSVLSYIYV